MLTSFIFISLSGSKYSAAFELISGKADLFEISTGHPCDIALETSSQKLHNKMKKYKKYYFDKDLLKIYYLN